MPRAASPATEIVSLLSRLSALIPSLVADAEFGRQVRRLTGGAAPASAPRAATAARPARKAGKRHPPLALDKVLDAMKGGKGYSLAEVASKLGESNKDRVASALRKLRDAGKVKVKGLKGQARWSAAA